jgi:phage regulator Rha-like protein
MCGTLSAMVAELYGVQTRRLVEQVKRNIDRFPSDFMFQLTKDEATALRSQSATSNDGHGGRRYAPYVFTEQGVAMLSGVLRSQKAVAVNIAIMRAFVELRRAATSYTAIETRLEDLERETEAKLPKAASRTWQSLSNLCYRP